MRDGYLIYDTHVHLGRALHSGRHQPLEQIIEWMDSAGVDRALLIPFPVVEDYRQAHDEIGAAIRAYPGRFAGAACLHPFLLREAFRDELKRCVEELGFRALKLQPQYHGLNPMSEQSRFYFEAALAFRLPIICHTGAGAPFALPSLFMWPAREYPELRLVLAHAGGGLYSSEAIVAASFCPNLFVELSWTTPHQAEQIARYIPANRLMIGSDLPQNAEAELNKILQLPVSEEFKRQVLWDTPRKLFDGV